MDIASTTSSPTLTQSVSFPPRTVTTLRGRSTSTRWRRDSASQSPSWELRVERPPAGSTRGRTPARSATTSAAVSGRSRASRRLTWPRRNARSSSVTPTPALVHPRVGGADHRPVAVRDDEERPAVVVEHRHHAVVRHEPRDDEVHALRERQPMAPGGPEQRTDVRRERAGGVDHDPCGGLEPLAGADVAQPHPPARSRPRTGHPLGRRDLDVVDGHRAPVQRGGDEVPDEPRVAVDEPRVRVLHRPAQARDVDERLDLGRPPGESDRGRGVAPARGPSTAPLPADRAPPDRRAVVEHPRDAPAAPAEGHDQPVAGPHSDHTSRTSPRAGSRRRPDQVRFSWLVGPPKAPWSTRATQAPPAARAAALTAPLMPPRQPGRRSSRPTGARWPDRIEGLF